MLKENYVLIRITFSDGHLFYLQMKMTFKFLSLKNVTQHFKLVVIVILLLTSRADLPNDPSVEFKGGKTSLY